MRLIPGDPAQVLLGFENTDPEQLAAVRRDLGLDRPITVQFVRWPGRLGRGELGTPAPTRPALVAPLAEGLPLRAGPGCLRLGTGRPHRYSHGHTRGDDHLPPRRRRDADPHPARP